MATSTLKRNSILFIGVIYVIAFLVVYCIFPLLEFSNSMINLFISDVIATLVIFLFSMIFSNSSVYDPYWSVIPPVLSVYLIMIFPGGNLSRQLLITALVWIWGIRLTFNWLRGWQGLRHQDWRYTSIAEKTGKWYWPVSFLGIHFMPTLFVFLGCLPLWFSLSAHTPLNGYDGIAALFTFVAILMEWIADEQLHRFRKKDNRDAFIRTGLWQYSRHPNYLGEIFFWGGMFLFVLSSSAFRTFAGYWTIIGFICMIVLFTMISIPLMEKRIRDRKPGYDGYARNVSALIPGLNFFRKRSGL
jgi:steroid 5-alpha reductase family enzyme